MDASYAYSPFSGSAVPSLIATQLGAFDDFPSVSTDALQISSGSTLQLLVLSAFCLKLMREGGRFALVSSVILPASREDRGLQRIAFVYLSFLRLKQEHTKNRELNS